MTEFDKLQWAKPEYSQEYRDSADVLHRGAEETA